MKNLLFSQTKVTWFVCVCVRKNKTQLDQVPNVCAASAFFCWERYKKCIYTKCKCALGKLWSFSFSKKSIFCCTRNALSPYRCAPKVHISRFLFSFALSSLGSIALCVVVVVVFVYHLLSVVPLPTHRIDCILTLHSDAWLYTRFDGRRFFFSSSIVIIFWLFRGFSPMYGRRRVLLPLTFFHHLQHHHSVHTLKRLIWTQIAITKYFHWVDRCCCWLLVVLSLY